MKGDLAAHLIGVSVFGSWAIDRHSAVRLENGSLVVHPFTLDHIRAGDDVFERLRLVEGTVVRHAHARLEHLIRRLRAPEPTRLREGEPE